MYLALTDRLLNIKFATEILENFDVDYCLLPGRNTVIVLTVLRKSKVFLGPTGSCMNLCKYLSLLSLYENIRLPAGKTSVKHAIHISFASVAK